ncbi:hypothetical protein JTB14_007787 [Gonioctena quinquepunctata]|nr:hypothetical protein JTB14_007787 [Gonioctena quinquepunctata]
MTLSNLLKCQSHLLSPQLLSGIIAKLTPALKLERGKEVTSNANKYRINEISTSQFSSWLSNIADAISIVSFSDFYCKRRKKQFCATTSNNTEKYEISCVRAWIPGHVGIIGNEEADEAARERSEESADDISIRIEDVKDEMKNEMDHIWQQEWDNENAKLKSIKGDVGLWIELPEYKRRESVILTRLRIGHTNMTSK